MGDPTTFLGGIVAIAVLGILLFIELSAESMLFVYVLAFMIALVAGALALTAVNGIMKSRRERKAGLRKRAEESGSSVREERKMETFFDRSEKKRAKVDVSNPSLKRLAERVGGKGAGKSRLSGIKAGFGRIGKKLKGIKVLRLSSHWTQRRLASARRDPRLGKGKLKMPGREPAKPGKVLKQGRKAIAEKPKAWKPKTGKSAFSGLVGRLKSIKRPKMPEIRHAEAKPVKAVPEEPAHEEASEEKIKHEASKPASLKEDESAYHPVEEKEPEKEIASPGKEKPEKVEPGESCHICGGNVGLGVHYITPLDRGGRKAKGNQITLCENHRKQAEQGMYSENLLRNLRKT